MADNRKISELNGTTTLANADEFTVVKDGENVKINVSDLNTALGVTGTIVADGASGATPILDKAGTVHTIRSVEDGNGIQASVSAENGITIAHNFSEDVTGSKIVSNLATANPTFRSLVGGDGINLSVTSDAITIDSTSLTTSQNVVIVNELADFPTPVAGVISLQSDTLYLVSGDVSIGLNRIQAANKSVIAGSETAVSKLIYTGTGTLFTSTVDDFKITNVTIDCASGTLINASSGGNGLFQMVNVIVENVATVGTIGAMSASQITDVAFLNITTDGLTFTGAHVIHLGVRNLFTIAAGTMYDLGTATFSGGFTMETSLGELNGSSVFLSGAAASANIGTNGLGTLHNMRFTGTGTPLNTISHKDDRWQMALNDDIQDSRPHGGLRLENNLTNTVIATVSVPVLCAGTWALLDLEQFTGTTAGRLTYTGSKCVSVDVDLSITAEPVSGGTKTLRFILFKNGVAVPSAYQENDIAAAAARNTGLIWEFDLDPNDYVELYVSNETDNIDVLVRDAIFRIGT